MAPTCRAALNKRPWMSTTVLEATPFYVIAGNHDWKGNVSAQIAYTKDSRRWNYPDWYYSENFIDEDVSLDPVMIDTVMVMGNTDDNDDKFEQAPGPADVARADRQ